MRGLRISLVVLSLGFSARMAWFTSVQDRHNSSGSTLRQIILSECRWHIVARRVGGEGGLHTVVLGPEAMSLRGMLTMRLARKHT
jgi:hypothetical protein